MASIKRTAIKIGIIKNPYIAGKGNVETIELLKIKVFDSVTTDIFYCEWSTNYGNLAISQQRENIIEGAKIRMNYNKTIVETLRNAKVVIYKNATVDDGKAFQLITSVEDIKEEHKEIEFQVKRMVDK